MGGQVLVTLNEYSALWNDCVGRARVLARFGNMDFLAGAGFVSGRDKYINDRKERMKRMKE